MHILIAPNAFKNSLTAQQAALAIQEGLLLSDLACTTTCFPIADGGDGTGSLIVEHLKGEWVEVPANDPLGRVIQSRLGLVDDGQTAVIEMADASGLRLLNPTELNPLKASSYGTGQLIKGALDKGAKRIIIAMGGSATVDGGCGILSALGFQFFDRDRNALEPIPESLVALDRVDTANADSRALSCEIIILCDVDNLLLGPKGAAAVFGPQKGADADTVTLLDGFLSKLAHIALKQTGTDMASLKYSGTAGGAAAGLHAFLGAKMVNGIDYFLNLTHFDSALQQADILITGEGSLDVQTLQGKGPLGVASRALTKSIPVIGLAGKVPLKPDSQLMTYFKVILPIGNSPANLPEALKNTHDNLVRTTMMVGNMLGLG